MKVSILFCFIIILLAGCSSVDDVPPEAYTAMADTCKSEGKELHVRKTIAVIELSCK